jgi:hypothetical protein
MRVLSGFKNSKSLIEIFFVCLVILLYFFKASMPFLKYPFIVLYICFIIYMALVYSDRFRLHIKDFIRQYILLIIILLFLFLAFISSNKIFLSVTKDILSIIILFTIFFFLSIIISIFNLKIFFKYLISLIILFALITSFYNILSILVVFKNDYFITYPYHDSLIFLYDNNFALVPVFFSFFAVLYYFHNYKTIKNLFYYHFALFVFTIHIILSGSKRGLLLFSVLISLMILLKIILLFREKLLIKNFKKLINIYLLTLATLSIAIYLFIFQTSPLFKNKSLEILGSKNVTEAKKNISNRTYKWLKIFNKNLNYLDYYNSSWFNLDPYDPDSGWGTRIHKTIFPLTGNNVVIVPTGTKGYLMDSTCNPDYNIQSSVCESYTKINTLNVKRNQKYYTSVFCFVSEDFNGNNVNLLIYGNGVKNRIYTINKRDSYDLLKKGYWKKLELNFDCNDGEVNICLSFIKENVKDFSSLKGYLIFAVPQYNIITTKDSDLTYLFCQDIKTKANLYSLHESSILFYNFQRSGDILDDINQLNNKIQFYRYSNYSGFTFCSFPFYLGKNVHLPLSEKDPFNNWITKFIAEDTTYYPYKATLFVNTFPNSITNSRTARWKFALIIFTKEYNWRQKVFGGGFNFLNWYGYYFQKDKTKTDYPHNPFLYILLYSGILGLSIYLFFLYKVFYYYLKYRKEYWIFFVFFLITFFFTFFSSGNPFDPPIMGFFVMLPFFIHSIHKKETGESMKVDNTKNHSDKN